MEKIIQPKQETWEEEFDRRFIGECEREGNRITFYGGIDPMIALEIKTFIAQELRRAKEV